MCTDLDYRLFNVMLDLRQQIGRKTICYEQVTPVNSLKHDERMLNIALEA